MKDDTSGTSPEPGWKDLAHRLGLNAERAFEHVRNRFDERFRPDRPLHVVPYLGHANDERATVSARVLVYTEPPDGSPDSLWHRLQASYRRFETDEVPGARVRLRAPGVDVEGTTDAEGYVHFEFRPPSADEARAGRVGSGAGGAARELAGDIAEGRSGAGTAGFEVTLSLPDSPQAPEASTAVVRPGPEARVGVISDVDDTVLVTEATSMIKMMRLTLLGSSESRVAFPGVGAFYRALAGGANPLFYVSSSPWNLYEFLVDFMRLNGLPEGPLLLRDLGIDEDKLGAGTHGGHKLDAIRSVLDRHAHLDFVLIGDSGQHDPEIYETIAGEYPGRVRAIYVRDVAGPARDAEVDAIAARLGRTDVEMLLVPDTLAAARHAASIGLIDAAELDAVAAEVRADLGPHEAVDAQRDGPAA